MTDQFSILITGDTFLGSNDIMPLAEKGDAENIFGEMLPVIKNAGLVITNFESPAIDGGTPILKSGPPLKTSTTSLGVLKQAGFNLVTLANNHIMDYGEAGLFETIDQCNKLGLHYTGAGENVDSAKKIYYKQLSEKKLAIINIAENEFGTTTNSHPGCHALDPVDNSYTIAEAKRNADIVIVIVHGGHEGYALPSPRMKKTYRYFVDQGADMVVSHHAHCYSGYEEYNNAIIFYGLGNFIFSNPQKSPTHPWNMGIALSVSLNPVLKWTLIPYYQNTKNTGIVLMPEADKEAFNKNIAALNEIIKDDKKLAESFSLFCQKKARLYSSYLEPHSIRALHFLRNRSIVPSFLSPFKRKLLLNLVRCEAHRDIVLSILSK